MGLPLHSGVWDFVASWPFQLLQGLAKSAPRADRECALSQLANQPLLVQHVTAFAVPHLDGGAVLIHLPAFDVHYLAAPTADEVARFTVSRQAVLRHCH